MEQRYEEYLITDCEKGLMVINENGVDCHTHCRDYNYAKCLVRWALKGTIPRHKSLSFLEDLARISKSLSKQRDINELVRVKRDKQTQKYNNEPHFYT